MALDTMKETIESAADLRDFIDVRTVLSDVSEKEIDFETAIRAQMESAGVEAPDEIVAELAEQLEAEMTQKETLKMAA